MLVVVLAGLLVLREPRLSSADDYFLGWLLAHSQAGEGAPVPLTVVEISRDSFADPNVPGESAERGAGHPAAVSPLEFALFLQSVLDFQPKVVAFENMLKWRDRDKDQEQVFLDQAMRVPKLLLASELSGTSDPDAPWGDIRGFTQVTGMRGDLAAFTGIARQPDEDLRLISTQGFVNLPDEPSSLRVPMLFLYRGEVIPSFALQAIMLWLRVTPSEVKIDLGSEILLPQNRRIPIANDGTLLIDPNAAKRARRLSLNEMLLAAQQRETPDVGASQQLGNITDQIVLARTPDNPLSPPDVFAAAIATVQSGNYLHRISRIFDLVVLLLIAASIAIFPRFGRVDLVLGGIAFTAAYCLIALGSIAKWNLWLPAILPLGALWFAILVTFFSRGKGEVASEVAIPPAIA